MDEYEKAWSDYHDDFVKRKNEILTKLRTIRKNRIPEVYKEWITQTIEFINEQKG